MFGMELWFALALLSALFGGLFIFTTKVAAERDYDVVLMSSVSIFLASCGFLGITLYVGDVSGMSWLLLIFSGINAVAFMWVNVLRHNAMQCIDATIYYPIYKTLTPGLVIIAGVLFFTEVFTLYEWLGLILSLLVPLLLISRFEKDRQKDLYRGLILLLGASLLALVATITIKLGTQTTANTLLFVTVTNFLVAAVGIVAMLSKQSSQPLLARLAKLKDRSFKRLIGYMAFCQFASFGSLTFAIASGPLGIVYTINSLYILIPIVLSIIFYNEHWNARKVIAIILSVAALALLQ